MFFGYSNEEKLLAYGILGGALLNDEPVMLLKMELREPNVYNSILEAGHQGL